MSIPVIPIAAGGSIAVDTDRINLFPSLNASGTLAFTTDQGNALGLALHALHSAELGFAMPLDGGTFVGTRSGSLVLLTMTVIGGAQDGGNATIISQPTVDEVLEVALLLRPL